MRSPLRAGAVPGGATGGRRLGWLTVLVLVVDRLDPRGDRGAGGGLGGRRRARGRSGARSTPGRTANCSRPQVDAVLAEAGARPARPGRDRRRARPGPVHRAAGRPGHRRDAWARRSASRRTASARWTRIGVPGGGRRAGAGRHRRPAQGDLLGGLRRRGHGSSARRWPRRRSPPRGPGELGVDRRGRATARTGTPRCSACRVRDEPRYPDAGRAGRARGRAGPGRCARREPLTPLYLRRPGRGRRPAGRKPVTCR